MSPTVTAPRVGCAGDTGAVKRRSRGRLDAHPPLGSSHWPAPNECAIRSLRHENVVHPLSWRASQMTSAGRSG